MDNNSHFHQVRNWMKAIGQDTPNSPTIPTAEQIKLRINLIQEELDELREACGMTPNYYSNGIECYTIWSEPDLSKVDLVAVADAISDGEYVILGAGVTFGINLDPVFDEVQKSNDTKLVDGFADQNGKWRKGPSFVEPNLGKVMEKLSKESIDG